MINTSALFHKNALDLWLAKHPAGKSVGEEPTFSQH